MQNSRELHYLLSLNPTADTAHFNFIQSNTPMFQSGRTCNPLYYSRTSPQVDEVNQQPTSFSNNYSTSDEADKHQLIVIDQRKQRRMISNRESARRSRMRKQRHLDELRSQVVWLQNVNHQLMDKLNRVSESHERALQENVQLKEETSELRQMVIDMQLMVSM